MDLIELIKLINQNGFVIALVIFMLSCVKLPKYELNLWQLFLKSVNKEINSKLDNLYKQFNELKQSFDRHIKEDTYDEMDQKRRNIINFSSEITRGIRHTEEQYNQIIEDVDEYEEFCEMNSEYHNTKAEASIKNIKCSYEECLKQNSFL